MGKTESSLTLEGKKHPKVETKNLKGRPATPKSNTIRLKSWSLHFNFPLNIIITSAAMLHSSSILQHKPHKHTPKDSWRMEQIKIKLQSFQKDPQLSCINGVWWVQPKANGLKTEHGDWILITSIKMMVTSIKKSYYAVTGVKLLILVDYEDWISFFPPPNI